MTDPRDLYADQFNAYVRTLLGHLNLTHWDAYLGTETAKEGANATIEPTDGRYVAAIRLAPDWFDRDPHDQRNDITHELLHLAHRDLTDHVRLTILMSDYIPAVAYKDLWNPTRLAAEQMVDHLAGVLAPLMPLPDFTGDNE